MQPVEPVSATGRLPFASCRRHRAACFETAPRAIRRSWTPCWRAIAAARSLIYIEHQYLSSRPIVAALAEALRRERDPRDHRGAQRERRRHRVPAVAEREARGVRVDGAPPRRTVRALERGGAARTSRSSTRSSSTARSSPWTMRGRRPGARTSTASRFTPMATTSPAWARRVFRHTRNFDVNVVVDGSIRLPPSIASVVGTPGSPVGRARSSAPRTDGCRSGARARRPTSPP